MPILNDRPIVSSDGRGLDRHQHRGDESKRTAQRGRMGRWLNVKRSLSSPDNPGNTVQKPFTGIVDVIAGLAGRYGKTYVWPTQKKLCELTEKFTGRSMSIRTLNRHLRALEHALLIKRTPRRRFNPRTAQWQFNSTLYRPRWRACQRFARNAKALFVILKSLGGIRGDDHVSKMASNLHSFFKEGIGQGP